MESKRIKNYLKLLLKLSLTALAVYIVIRRIDLDETKRIFLQANLFWLIVALVFFNVSKILSAYRLNAYFKSIGLCLNNFYNLKLYYLGMFYNLFLPGGIGGDGYKVYLLNRQYKTSLKDLISGTLLDRISGLVALLFLAFLLGCFLDLSLLIKWAKWVLIGGVVISYPAYYISYRLLFQKFLVVFHQTNFMSIGVQGLQLICAWFILLAIGVDELYLEYQVVFLLSSVVAVLPFTIGGVGARELVFVFSAAYLSIDTSTAVAFSILFFLITAVSSFTGVFFDGKLKEESIK
ncbi:YbhN family protein [Bacteroidota bacterium]